jgi:hypothetical protein
MNDGLNPEQANGFTPGNEIIYRFWNSANGEITDVSAIYPIPIWDDSVFTAQGMTACELYGHNTMDQILLLPAGWSGISSWVAPYNTSISGLLSDISEKVDIISNNDQYYQPVTGSGSLENWDFKSGYLIKLSEQAELTFEGVLPDLNAIELSAGWNLIPVLSENNVLLQDVFSGNLDKVQVVKDAVGLKTYWPQQNVFTLQVLQPGKAYLIKVNEEFTLSW